MGKWKISLLSFSLPCDAHWTTCNSNEKVRVSSAKNLPTFSYNNTASQPTSQSQFNSTAAATAAISSQQWGHQLYYKNFIIILILINSALNFFLFFLWLNFMGFSGLIIQHNFLWFVSLQFVSVFVCERVSLWAQIFFIIHELIILELCG